MCCQETRTLGLPAEVIEALAHYRRLLDEHGPDWGEQIDFFRLARFSLIGPAFEAFMATGDWATAIRSVIGGEVPVGIVVVRVDEDGLLRADGAVLDLAAGESLDIRARVQGPGAEHLTFVGPDGVVAQSDAASDLRYETILEEGPTWISAVARGTSHPNTLDESVLAHTSPVYVDVDGQRVARGADARWCLEFLDTLEQFVGQHGHFHPATRDAHFGDLVAVLEEARSFYRRVAETAVR